VMVSCNGRSVSNLEPDLTIVLIGLIRVTLTLR